jgi:superoxide dismutase, Fe-Mn family
MQTYNATKFDLSGLNGISDETLELHFKLYEGYVTNTNLLNEQISELSGGNMDAGAKAKFSELARRLGFEYNGMVLHEYYFGNMKKNETEGPASGNAFRSVVEDQFDGFDKWKSQFSAMGGMRGIGWVVCYQDLKNGALSNHWINEHQDGNVAGFAPILIMDVWEHAFLLDYKPAEKSKYIEAFFTNVDWDVVAGRLQAANESIR